MDNQSPHAMALSKAKIKMMQMPDCAFFTTLLLSLKVVWDEECSTAWTNGLELGLNPKFFLSLDQDTQVFVLTHEVLHVALMHVEQSRAATKQRGRWGHAADYVINQMLHERNFKMPTWVLRDENYKNMSTEEVYNLLPEEMEPPKMDDIRFGSGDKSAEQMKKEIDDIIVRASIQSQMSGDKPGSIPGAVELYLDNLLNPKLPWQQLLRNFVTRVIKSGYNYKRPNRRFAPDHYLPSLRGEGMKDIVCAVDISCSVTDEEFKQQITEVANIFKMMKPKKITVILFDTRITSIYEVHSIAELKAITFHGRGGTDITDVIEWANKNKPFLLLFLSDGGFHFPKEHYKGQVIWLVYNNPKWTAPYGKVVHYEI